MNPIREKGRLPECYQRHTIMHHFRERFSKHSEIRMCVLHACSVCVCAPGVRVHSLTQHCYPGLEFLTRQTEESPVNPEPSGSN